MTRAEDELRRLSHCPENRDVFSWVDDLWGVVVEASAVLKSNPDMSGRVSYQLRSVDSAKRLNEALAKLK
jgi:hypothetical protein